jgi:Ecdysteroid kinase-like family
LISTTPFSADELSAGWLTDALKRSGGLRSAEVSSFEGEPIGGGTSFLSQLLRIHLSYDALESGAPSTLIAKFPSAIPAVRQLSLRTGMYLHEVSFYQELSDRPGIGIPRCYFAGVNQERSGFLLLLEDLRDGVFGDQLAGGTPDQARHALAELARFHAYWWKHPRLNELTWLRKSTPEMRDRLQAMYEARLPAFLSHADALLTPSERLFCPALAKNLRPLLEDAAKKKHFTLGHGDFRVDNVFFPSSSLATKPLVVLDWQRVNRACAGTNDIANFIAMGLSTDDLNAHREVLLRSYYTEFVKSGIDGYSFSDLREGYRVSLLETLLFVIVASGLMEVEAGNQRSSNLAVVIFARLLNAIEEANAWELLE